MSQKEKILELLEQRSTVDNYALNQVAFRYAARIAELRADGYNIKARHDKGSRWLFTLVREPVQMGLI